MFRSKKRPLTNLLLYFIAITSIAVNSLLATHVVHAAPVTLEEVNNSYYASILLSDCYRQKIGKRENPNSQNGDELHSIPPDRDLNSIFKADAAPFVTTSVYIGRYYEPNDGIVACNEGTILKKAMQDLGYPELSSFLLAIGYKKVETTFPSGYTAVKYELSADDRSSRDSAERAIRALGANQTDSSKYIALKKVFDRHCQVTAQNTSQGGSRTTYTEIVKDPNDSERYITKDTPVDLLAKESGKTPTSEIKTYDYNEKNTNCRDLLSEMNGLAGNYAVYMSTSPNASSEGEPVVMGGQSTGTPSNEIACAAGAIGWLLCPLMTTLSDSVMLGAEIIGNFMQFEPLLGGGPDSSGEAIRGIWQRLVGISNLLLVVAFMVVIFSQATSIGLSAYGIKKMLPRIIAAAILINISYYICALLVDVFNIIGANIGGVIESASSSIPITGELRSDSPGVVAQIAGTVTALITVVGLWGFAAGSVAFLVPILVTALVSVLFIAVVLALRHIMAILLIIVSPLAFAAMILPNTADLFKKWWKGLVTVLALYPVIMILAYGSLLVSKIILATAPDKAEDNFIIYFLTVAIALVVQVVWIFALKFIVTWGGGLVGKIGGMINDPQKGIIDRSKNWAKNKDARSTLGQARMRRKQAGDDNAAKRAYKRLNAHPELAAIGMGPNARRLLQTQISGAAGKIDSDETAAHEQQLTRKSSEMLARGYKKQGNVWRNAAGDEVRQGDVDQATWSALDYANRNELVGNKNGARAIAQNLYNTGGMNEDLLSSLHSGLKQGDRAEFVAHSNNMARERGYKHMMFAANRSDGSLDMAGNLRKPENVNENEHDLVASKVVGGGMENISKETWDDSSFSQALTDEIMLHKNTNRAAYDESLTKMNPETIKKMAKSINQGGYYADESTAHAALISEQQAAINAKKQAS